MKWPTIKTGMGWRKFLQPIYNQQYMAEGVGFEPTVALRLLLISSQMPLTTQPPFQPIDSII